MKKKYQVLARKYRPQTFAEVVGQQPALTTLKNALKFDQVAHAYLFSGSRGVGKTTLARLFAKALNCSGRGEELEPCNQCSSCQEIISGQSLDVIEIDGASNRGIDDIRQINETVGYAPSHGKYKIYIIDEVHMLTKEAFNALLKTLEEPPEKAKFFFATTEPHKVLPTIISRCQRFDLLRIDASEISRKLGEIALDMGREADVDALHLIASFADGSLRDAESLFDQILCFSSDRIESSTVREALGLVPEQLFFELDQAFSDYRLSYAFELVETLFQSGKDLAHFLEQLVDHYRSICLCKTVDPHSLPAHVAKKYGKAADLYTQPQALYILDSLLTAESAMQKSPFPRVTLESALLHIIRSKNRLPLEVITRRLHALEEALKIAGTSLPPFETVETPLERKETPPTPPPSVFEPAAPSSASFTPNIETKLTNAPIPSMSSSFLPKAEETSQTACALAEAQEEMPSVFAITELQPEIPEEAPLPQEPIAAPSVFTPEPQKQEMEAPQPLAETHPFTAPSVFAHDNKSSPALPRPASHYETMMRFAAVELEGTLKM